MKRDELTTVLHEAWDNGYGYGCADGKSERYDSGKHRDAFIAEALAEYMPDPAPAEAEADSHGWREATDHMGCRMDIRGPSDRPDAVIRRDVRDGLIWTVRRPNGTTFGGRAPDWTVGREADAEAARGSGAALATAAMEAQLADALGLPTGTPWAASLSIARRSIVLSEALSEPPLSEEAQLADALGLPEGTSWAISLATLRGKLQMLATLRVEYRALLEGGGEEAPKLRGLLAEVLAVEERHGCSPGPALVERIRAALGETCGQSGCACD